MTKEQTALDIARRMAELGERSHAVTAYTLAMADARDRQPETELEAALYLFENGGNYKVAYDAFRSLYRRGFQRESPAGSSRDICAAGGSSSRIGSSGV